MCPMVVIFIDLIAESVNIHQQRNVLDVSTKKQ